jgi:uncharacterized oxidoreductase
METRRRAHRLSTLRHHLQPQPATAVEQPAGTVGAAELLQFVTALLVSKGSAAAEAAIVAAHLLEANLKGHDSHGVGMLPQYFNSIDRGLLVPNAPLLTVSRSGSMLVFDAQHGFGQVAARAAVLEAAEVALELGVCVFALRHAGHIGRVGTYAELAAERGLVFLSLTNVGDHAPLVAPDGGTQARFGTNPVTMGFPPTQRNAAVVLDMATSTVALGKVRVAFNKGEEMAPGSLIDGQGEPTNDPAVMFGSTGTGTTAAVPTGALRPFGEHKGGGLALMCELLAGAVGGGGTIQPGNARADTIVNNLLAVVFDPARLTAQEFVEQEADAMLDYLRSTPPAAGRQVRVAGEPESASKLARAASGVPVDGNTWSQLCELAAATGVRPPPTSNG